jgi:hypothetical protein
MIVKEYSRYLIGYNDNEPIYLSPPKWGCGWYWGFGYLGNKNCHYHIDGLAKDCNLYDGFKKHFKSTLTIRDSHLWTICELFKTFYVLKEAAEVLGRGGSHYSKNPCKDIITNKDEVKRINEIVLPAIFEEIYKILKQNESNSLIFKELVDLNVQGNTAKVVDFMLFHNIHTDDLKNIKQLTNHDFQIIHSFYWKKYHNDKKRS